MRVHCHRERGGGVRVVSVGTCRADLWVGLQCNEGHICLDLGRVGRILDPSPFQDLVSILSQVSWSQTCTCAKVAAASFENVRPENGPVYQFPVEALGFLRMARHLVV